jgi:hypothetical protein
MITPEYLDTLESCEPGCDEETSCEMKTAMKWLNDAAKNYPTGQFIPPLTPLDTVDNPRNFAAFTVKTRMLRPSGLVQIRSIELYSGTAVSLAYFMTETDGCDFIIMNMLTRNLSGCLFACSKNSIEVLSIMLEQFGPQLVKRGYSLQPFASGGGVLFVTIRKGKQSWRFCYVETIAGVRLSVLLGYAQDVKVLPASYGRVTAAVLYSAIGAYQSFLLATFGVAINPTAGMTAVRCVRRSLPEGFRKWRPDPLLVSMEREGKGYRGGMTYATKYRGPSVRIDVNRQYTAALSAALPYRAAFGRYISPEHTPHGVFLCRVQLTNFCPYPLGIWNGEGFTSELCARGTYLSVLHTSEFPGLESIGASITPYYGFIFTRTFQASKHIERLQSILDNSGRNSNIAQISKPLGNHVYGKLGQNPEQEELTYALDRPPGEWYPYVDGQLKEWRYIWTRENIRYTGSQHVEIAATITGHARSQTLQTWALLSTYGQTVVRCHTDSLTVSAQAPFLFDSTVIPDTPDQIGEWRVEYSDVPTTIVAANAYSDDKGAHIAGVSEPTQDMIDRMYAGEVVVISQQQNTPLSGWTRERRTVRKRLSG